MTFYKRILNIQIGLIAFLLVCLVFVAIWSAKRRNARKRVIQKATTTEQYSRSQNEEKPEQESREYETSGHIGFASYYSDLFHENRTASGEPYSKGGLTAAHRTYPFGTHVRVTNIKNGKSVIVRINDRGPLKKERIIDLSGRAAQEIGLTKAGVTKVKVEVMR